MGVKSGIVENRGEGRVRVGRRGSNESERKEERGGDSRKWRVGRGTGDRRRGERE